MKRWHIVLNQRATILFHSFTKHIQSNYHASEGYSFEKLWHSNTPYISILYIAGLRLLMFDTDWTGWNVTHYDSLKTGSDRLLHLHKLVSTVLKVPECSCIIKSCPSQGLENGSGRDRPVLKLEARNISSDDLIYIFYHYYYYWYYYCCYYNIYIYYDI